MYVNLGPALRSRPLLITLTFCRNNGRISDTNTLRNLSFLPLYLPGPMIIVYLTATRASTFAFQRDAFRFFVLPNTPRHSA